MNTTAALGEKLTEAKESLPHGQWDKWASNHNSELCFGTIQASKYMMVANNKLLVLEYFNNEQTIDRLTKAISDATPEQLEKVEQLKREQVLSSTTTFLLRDGVTEYHPN